jgi:hypothetical protein
MKETCVRLLYIAELFQAKVVKEIQTRVSFYFFLKYFADRASQYICFLISTNLIR